MKPGTTKRIEKIAEQVLAAKDTGLFMGWRATERGLTWGKIRALAKAVLAKKHKPTKHKPISKLSPRGRAVKERKLGQPRGKF